MGRVRQSAEALVAHPVEQLVLHLLVGQVVQTLEHQDPHHRLGRVRRTPALRAHRARRNLIHLGRQRRKVDVRLDLGQRVAQRVDLLAVVFVSEQVGLDGATRFHRCRLRGSGRRNFTKGGRGGGFSRCPIVKRIDVARLTICPDVPEEAKPKQHVDQFLLFILWNRMSTET